jgi:hypothetical protein
VKREKNAPAPAPTEAWDAPRSGRISSRAIHSGAEGANYGKPEYIPQDAPHNKATHEAFESFFDFDRDGKRDND